MQPLINQWRQIRAALGGKFEAAFDGFIMGSANEELARKKEQGGEPCSRNCVDPIFPAILIRS
jgi:hypothetical protein